jgi:hypothetical protein
VLSEGLACFHSVTAADFRHEAIVTGGKHQNDLPKFRWINTILSNLKTSLNGALHALISTSTPGAAWPASASASTAALPWQR